MTRDLTILYIAFWQH